ncbi:MULTISPECIES: hypothetical protein [unclassified Halomonas]|uniref:hypothetical protein n=1 Tax=unclassified Halomonas TaxID=2609666 RepID=UPI00054EBA3D|nr:MULTISPECIES: hypothetical protein [unclassified Halomonas]MBR9902656.1 hypothetical protein [Gammaproteobacteria bacterium]CEP36364.1 Putative uncharacterized protein [Halomonas sp. R57-5]
MKLNKLTISIGAASALMLGISQAQAFDQSHWKWDLNVKTDVDQYIDIDIDAHEIDPDGLTLVEIDQTFNGSVNSVSTVTDIDNMSKPDTDIEFDWEAKLPIFGKVEGDANLHIDNSDWGLGELGAIESTATAVANNGNLVTDAMTNLDASQIWNGSGTVTATSYVGNIDNMTVDSAATAVANNLSVDVQPTYGSDSILLANIVQTGTGTVSAFSTVNDVDLSVAAPSGFEGPHISSVATAVGNNVNVSVGNLGN